MEAGWVELLPFAADDCEVWVCVEDLSVLRLGSDDYVASGTTIVGPPLAKQSLSLRI
ncbi:MAG: hypothetical protein P8O03_13930 [Ilumatobacter sp.]|nr:hypothetical protein [Ilumatobacter sp.]MDG2041114.1 hypothetical protein [Ilumatobacter sp.]